MRPSAVERAESLLGTEAETWAAVARKGYSINEHWTVAFADGTRAFVKEAAIDSHPEWTRRERHVYDVLSGSFMPRFIAFEDGKQPLLVLEDLMPARWPPPWRDGDVELVLEALDQLHGMRAELPRHDFANDWRRIADDPRPFLSTGLRDAAWLERLLPQLVELEPPAGDAVIHCDVRSDNLCIKDGRAVLVDWNFACLGDPRFDVAFWAPSLALERGPEPWTLGVDEIGPVVAGFFAARAGLPSPPGAPAVRDLQRLQAEIALEWVDRVR